MLAKNAEKSVIAEHAGEQRTAESDEWSPAGGRRTARPLTRIDCTPGGRLDREDTVITNAARLLWRS